MKHSKNSIHFCWASSPFNSYIEYVLDFILHHPLTPTDMEWHFNSDIVEKPTCTIFYGENTRMLANHNFQIPRQNLLFSSNIYSSSDLRANGYQYKNYTLWSVEKAIPEFAQFIDNQRFNFDIIEMLFYHISRYEEYHAPASERDWNDELPSNKHFLVKNQLHHQPVVDHLIYCFWKSLGFNPPLKATCFRMTHDIDVLRKYPNIYTSIRAVASAAWHERSVQAVKEVLKSWYETTVSKKTDPYDSFAWLLTEKPVEKVIYFMAGGQTRYDNFYEIDAPETQKIIEKAKAAGYEIGLHPSYNCYLDEQLFLAEKQKLEKVVEQKISHLRMHYLRFRFTKTLQIIEACGMHHDSTMGYNDRMGFRCGTGFAYRLFDFEHRRPGTIWETPMIVMDGGLLNEVNYQVETAKILLEDFLKKNQYLTKITFNFHNSIFNPARVDDRALRAFYLALIGRISSR